MHPLKLLCTLGQRFGGNLNPFYSSSGLIGHPGIDEACGYGTDIQSYVNGFVYSLYTPQAPANDGYTAIFTIVETPLEIFEFAVGHVSRIDVHVGDQISIGQVVGAEGNHGLVYQGDTKITLAMQAAGDHRGAHRHIQKRPCYKVRSTKPGRTYLQAGYSNPYRDSDGNYYEVVAPGNGFAGCTDPLAPLFPRDLFIGRTGYDVYLLQRVLWRNGIFDEANCIGTFGPKTAAAVIQYQRMLGISPMLGYVGVRTRATLNALYTQL